MNRIALTLTRPAVRLRRLPHRRGYGVHSPFAFEYITRVVLEHTPYYLYRDLQQQEAQQTHTMGYAWAHREPRRVKRLLLRIANRARPDCIVDVGARSAAAIYLQGGRRMASYHHVDVDQLQMFQRLLASGLTGGTEFGPSVRLIYLHDYQRPAQMHQAWEKTVAVVGEHDVVVVEGICYSRQMRALWQTIKNHPRTGITFDLYDLGIVLMDRGINKRDYVVSF